MADIEEKHINIGLIPTVTAFRLLLLMQLGIYLSFGQPDPPYVAVLRSPVATTEDPTVIDVYSRNASVEFDKAVLLNLTGILKDQRYQFRGNDPPVPIGSVINTTNELVTLMLPPTLTPAERTGIYTISVTEDGKTFRWRVLVTNEDATIRAVEYSAVSSRGDDITVSAETNSFPMQDLRWRKDGVWDPLIGGSTCRNTLSCGDANLTASMIVFECQRMGQYRHQEHAIMNVVVRECEPNKWGPPGCMNDCQPCINGGICSDLTGWCLCPPGFSGCHCENVHGSNVFGQNAEYRCDDSGDDHSDGCQGAMICYPNPFGCICPAGYTGLDCMETCERGKFGANCKQECHCNDNSLCALDTGVCEGRECEPGWYGVNCQLTEMPAICPSGVYGDFCKNPCSCKTEDCSDVETNCAAGCAVPWTGSACNQNTSDGIIDLSYVKVNPGQVTAVRCSVIRNPPISEGDLILSLAGTPCTDCDNQNSDRIYNLTKTVMITLSTPVEVTCSVRNTSVMKTTMLVPYVSPVYANPSNVLTFSGVTSTSIRVEWPAWDDINDIGDGPIVDYKIQMRENRTEAFSNESKGTDLVHQFIDLTPDTLYEFRMTLVREGPGGEGAPSNVQRQRTLNQGQSDPAYVAVVRSPVATTENPTVIEVYRGDASVEFDKAILLNQNDGSLERQRYQFTGNIPPVPAGSVIDPDSDPATLMLPATLTPAERTGIYTISVTENQRVVIWRVSLTKKDATILAEEYSTVISRGDPVTATVETDKLQSDLRWRRDGVWYNRFGYDNCTRSLSCTDASISPRMFVFECHEAGRYDAQEHAIMNVIVRECERNKWGPPGCMNDCQPCINGGICSDLTGLCLCPPGFSGNHCENVYGGNVFGQNAEYRCDDSGDEHSNGCQGAMICYPYPFGCICPAGYTGLGCMETCERGKFGANCKQECHCLDNSLCASDTGVCEDGECESGWFGVNCQLSSLLPRNVIVADRNESSLTIAWDVPVNVNENITHYQLQYRAIEKLYDRQFVLGEFGQSIEVTNQGENNIYVLNALKPSTLYEIKISAFTVIGQGDFVSIDERTDLFTGLEPPPVNSKIRREGTIARLTLPALVQQYASGYYIRVKTILEGDKAKRSVDGLGHFEENPDHYITAEVEKSGEEQTFTVGDGKMYGIYYNAPLSQDREYEVFVGTGTKSREDVNVAWSNPLPVTDATEKTIAAPFLAPALTVLVLVLLVVFVFSFIVFRRCQQRKGPDTEAGGLASSTTNIPLQSKTGQKDEGESANGTNTKVKLSSSPVGPSDDYTIPDQDQKVYYEMDGSETRNNNYDDVSFSEKPTSDYEDPTIDVKREEVYDDVDLEERYIHHLRKSNVSGGGHLKITTSTLEGRFNESLDVDDCYDDPSMINAMDTKYPAGEKKPQNLPKKLLGQHSDEDEIHGAETESDGYYDVDITGKPTISVSEDDYDDLRKQEHHRVDNLTESDVKR